MEKKLSDLDQTKMAMGVLFACIVKALDEREAGVREAFERSLGKAYAEIRDFPYETTGVLEALSWTKDCLKDL